MAGIIIEKQPEKVITPPNKNSQHFNPDSLFVKDKLSGLNADGRVIRFWKVTSDGSVGYGECLDGEEKPNEAEWVSPIEYFKFHEGEQEYERLKGHFREYKRMLQVLQLQQIRKNSKDLVDKINGKIK